MSGSEEDEGNLPSAAECQKAIENFVQITTTDEALAQFYLQAIITIFCLIGYVESIDSVTNYITISIVFLSISLIFKIMLCSFQSHIC